VPYLRLLVDPPAEAAWNMAVDEALLAIAEAPTLRLYAWWPHAVSLGWFQRLADFADLPPGTRIVRRLTGGGAIHHGDELTFALAVDAELLPHEVAASYPLLHDAVKDALASCGIACERLAAGPAPRARPGQRWCFADPGRDDLVTARGKLLGSAQRRVTQPRPRVLHHGSLVLQPPALTPFVASLADAGRPIDRERLRREVAAHVARALGLQVRQGLLSGAEGALAADLCGARYEQAAFTAQR